MRICRGLLGRVCRLPLMSVYRPPLSRVLYLAKNMKKARKKVDIPRFFK